MSETTTIVCVVCPISCPVLVEWQGDGIIRTDHNQCKLALEYVEGELFNPQRTLTSSLPVLGGRTPLVSVKSKGGLSKDRLLEAMQAIAHLEVKAPVQIGDVIVDDLLGTGVSLVATRDVPAA